MKSFWGMHLKCNIGLLKWMNTCRVKQTLRGYSWSSVFQFSDTCHLYWHFSCLFSEKKAFHRSQKFHCLFLKSVPVIVFILYIFIITTVSRAPKGCSSVKIAHSFLILDMSPAIKERSNLSVIRHHRVNTPQNPGTQGRAKRCQARNRSR